MLRVIPRGWFSGNFDVYDRSGALLGRVDLSSWRERARLEVGGTRYEATHKSGRKEFVLTQEDGTAILTAEKPSALRQSALRQSFRFEHGGNVYELRKESVWRRAFTLYRDGAVEVGSVRPGGMFERSWSAELPEELPPEARVLVMWLVRSSGDGRTPPPAVVVAARDSVGAPSARDITRERERM